MTLSDDEVDTIVEYTTRIGKELNVKGLMNIQYVVLVGIHIGAQTTIIFKIREKQIYVIEVNPRSSRTIPFISKITGVPMVKLA
ncbi:MAG: hypothetical protein CM1200mP3_18250 [Chloroflexota bacterium]|nr:MAG: hypothetical protein CM1200mP3_18250 [Chloroflexota bacterium]